MARNIYCRTLTSSGLLTISDTALGKGGEGSVYSVEKLNIDSISKSADNLVVKLYHDPTEGNRARKIAAMIQNPVDTSFIAWPLAIVFDENKQFAGYLMEKLQKDSYRPWEELANARDRRGTSSDFDFRYALTAARNLAVALDSTHSAGHMLGDINESNIFIASDARVLIVDSDSAQVVSSQNEMFPCIVGKAEYTAPEISKGSFKDNPRTVATDVFAYSIAIFQILTGGFHPTDGIYTKEGESTLAADRIRENVYPSIKDASRKGYKKLPRIPFNRLPNPVQKIIERSLSQNPSDRPAPEAIVNALDTVLQSLKQCSKFKQHWYSDSESRCVWCVHYEETSFDPWVTHPNKPKASNSFKQVGLPTVNFSDSSQSTTPKRAPIQTSPQQTSSYQQAPQGQFNFNSSPNSSQNYQQGSNANNSQNFNQGGQQGNNYSQQGPGYSQSGQNQSSQQQKPRGPEFHKGKIILEYADGSRRVRPAYSVLFKNNPKMGFYCLREETPSLFQAWWSTSRPVARILGLLIGLFVALGISVSWYFTVPLLEPLIPELSFTGKVLEIAGIASAVTAGIGSLCLFFSSVKDLVKSKKLYKDLSRVKRESWWKTSLRFIPIAIAYGPIIVIILVYLVLWGIVKMITSPENN